MKDPGNVTRTNDGYQVVFDRLLPHNIEKVWDAITNPGQMKYWFTDIDLDPEPGGKIVFRFRDKNQTLSYGEVISVKPPTHLAWTWTEGFAEWELRKADDSSTHLRLTYSRLVQGNTIRAAAGFHLLLDKLENRLNGSGELNPFGTEEEKLDDIRFQVHYAEKLFDEYPEALNYKPVVIERIYEVPVEKVWKALTDKYALDQWYFQIDEFKPEPGFQFSFKGEGKNGESFIHNCTITELIPGRKLQYSWQYKGYEGYTLVSFELSPLGDKTKLRITHHGIWSFPEEQANLSQANFEVGWKHIAEVGLQEFLDKAII